MAQGTRSRKGDGPFAHAFRCSPGRRGYLSRPTIHRARSPSALATSFSYGAARLVAQSWRESDAGDFRTDAIRNMEQWNIP